MRTSESDLVFNVIFTPGTFSYLRLFTRSLIEHSDLHLRLVANGCRPDEVEAMEAFAQVHDGRVREVMTLSTEGMAKHGHALDELYAARRDGEHFCFVDSDVKANRPFMPLFLDLLDQHAAVTSGRVAWTDDSVVPTGSLGVAGRHFVDEDGFVYGSSYLAIYRREAVDRATGRWQVGFPGYSRKNLPAEVRATLESMGRRFELFDTAKVLNILLQADGSSVHHVENPDLVHIGGMSAYLSDAMGRPGPSLERGRGVGGAGGVRAERHDFAAFAASTLMSLVAGDAPPVVPGELEPVAATRFRAIASELTDLVETYAGR